MLFYTLEQDSNIIQCEVNIQNVSLNKKIILDIKFLKTKPPKPATIILSSTEAAQPDVNYVPLLPDILLNPWSGIQTCCDYMTIGGKPDDSLTTSLVSNGILLDA